MWIAVGLTVGLFAAVVVDTVKMMRAIKRNQKEREELDKKLAKLTDDIVKLFTMEEER
jgi:heme exporter protein D